MNKIKVIGILMLLIFVTGILSIVYVIESPDYLIELPHHLHEVYIGGAAQLLMVGLYIGLIALINPIIMNYDKKLSNYFVVARSISLAFHLLGLVLLMLFIPLSDAYTLSDNQVYNTLGDMLRLGRDLTNHIGVIIPYLLGSFIFYYVLLKKNLKHKWLVNFGFFAIVLTGLSSILILFNVITLVSTTFALMSIPLALQEILLALSFIFKKDEPSFD